MPRKLIGLKRAPRTGAGRLGLVLLIALTMGGLSACSSTTTGNTANAGVTANTGNTGNTGATSSTENTGNTGNTGNGDFCSTHTCIPNFPNGTGYIVQCADGEWSHSGGRSGACSDHGGETGNTPGNTSNTGNTGSTTANTGNTGATTSNTGNTGGGSGSSPLATVNSYWNSISNHDYASAYSDLAPRAANQTQAQFIAQEDQAGIQSVSFNGHLTAVNGSTAIVSVDSLTTTDKQFGCRDWNGSYHLVQQSGQWLIEQATINPQPC
jgi:hypothetical protein